MDELFIRVNNNAPNIPRQTSFSRLLIAVSAQFINQLADRFGRDLIFQNVDPNKTPNVSHAELLRLMEANVGNDRIRQMTYECTRRLLTPIIQYHDLLLTPNDQTLEQNTAAIQALESQITDLLLPFFGL